MGLFVIDIGGTNLRYSELVNSKKPKINKIKIESKKNFDEILISLIKTCKEPIENLVISAAGPKLGSLIKMTNQNLIIDPQSLKKKLRLKNCFLLNDLEAAGNYLKKIKPANKKILKKGKKINSNQVLIIPGTGLGLSLVLDNKKVVPSEIGNSKILVSDLINSNSNFEISNFSRIEDFISGPGITHIYNSIYKRDISSREIIKHALHKDSKALNVIKIFLEMLAKFLAEVALIYLPGNGIFLSGSFMRSLEIFIDKKKFTENFLKQVDYPHKQVLELIEINLIFEEHLSIYGCIEYFNSTQKGLN